MLVSFVRDRDHTAGRRAVAQFHLNQLRFFLHSHPPKFTDEMKNFYRWPSIVYGGDLSTLQIGVHGFSPLR